MTDTPTLKPCPTKADFTEAFDMTHRLIQEAKPREGYITDHLDAAEGWLDKLEEMLDAYRTRTDAQPTQSDVERVARALAQADGIEICSDATYALSSYGHKAQAALAAMRQPTQSNVAAAGTDRIGGGGGLPCGVVGVATQSDAVAEGVLATQKAHTMLLEVLAEWGIEVRNATAQQLAVVTTEALCRAIDQIEDLRAQAQAQYDRGYYDGCANPIVRYDALRDALADLLHAVCGKTGFAETVRRDSGRVYPWPALDLAEAKAIAALEQSK